MKPFSEMNRISYRGIYFNRIKEVSHFRYRVNIHFIWDASIYIIQFE